MDRSSSSNSRKKGPTKKHVGKKSKIVLKSNSNADSSLDSRGDSDVSDIHPRSMFNDVTDGLEEKEASPDPEVGVDTKVGSKELDDKLSMEESPDHSSSDGKDDSDDELISAWKLRAGKST